MSIVRIIITWGLGVVRWNKMGHSVIRMVVQLAYKKLYNLELRPIMAVVYVRPTCITV
jgi:hypothetical protein